MQNKLHYEEITEENILLASNIQIKIFPKECAYNFYKWSIEKNVDYIKYYIIYNDNTPIGITGIYNYDNFKENTIWLGWFGILEEYRNKGYGRQALLDTIEMARKLTNKHPLLYFRIYTYKKANHLAQPMYQKYLDLKEEYTNKNDYKVKDDICYIYTKTYTDKIEYWNNRYAYINEDVEKEKISKSKREEIINYNEK